MNEPDIRVKNTPIFKLKDKDKRRFQAIHLKKQFGFIPEVIIIEKVPNLNNGLIVRAILTEEEKKKEDARKEKLQVKENTDGKPEPSTTDSKTE